MNRIAWIKATYRELLRRCGEREENLNADQKANYMGWAESLAETYYDEFPNDYSPKIAVDSDLSYA